MLTQTTEYALQALAVLAAAPEAWHDVRQLSETLQLPANYLSKVLGQLTKLGVLESRKGWGGGFRLRRPPAEVTLGEVVRPFEGAERPRPCVFGLAECSEDHPCPLHERWKHIRALQDAMLDETTLADLAADFRRRPPAPPRDDGERRRRRPPRSAEP